MASRLFLVLLTTICLFTAALTDSAKAQSRTLVETDYTKSLSFSEINWAGSSFSTSDEWIEFYNSSDEEINLNGYQLLGAGGTNGLLLTGVIKPNDYFLISNFDFGSQSTNLQVKANQVTSTISISNTAFDLILKDQNGNIIDEVNTLSQPPFAGSTTPKRSMIRKDFTKSGSDKTNWESSNVQVNVKAKRDSNQICQIDYGSPLATNLAVNQISTFEIKNLCFENGIVSNNSLIIENPKIDAKLLDFDFNFDAGKQVVKLFGDFNGEINSAVLDLKLDSESTTLQNSEQFQSNKFWEKSILTNSKTKNVSLNLKTFQGILKLDRIEISPAEITESPEQLFDFKTLLIPKEDGRIKLDPNLYCLDYKFCEVSFDVKIENLNESSLNNVARIYFGNKTQKNLITKDLNVKDFTNSIYKANFKIENNFDLIQLQIIPSNNNKISISNFQILQSSNFSTSQFNSRNNLDWSKQLVLKTTEANGLNGKLLDILETNKLSTGNYSLSYKIKKLENSSSGSDLIRIYAYNDRGVKVFDEVKDENDLVLNQEYSNKVDFNLKTDSKIYIFIKFYGNYFGAKADIEFGEISINN